MPDDRTEQLRTAIQGTRDLVERCRVATEDLQRRIFQSRSLIDDTVKVIRDSRDGVRSTRGPSTPD